MAYIGTSPSNGVRRIHTYTATAGQTTFTGSSTEGVTLTYADTNYIDVFQNGVLLGSADYTSTSGTSVVLAQGASVSDLVVIVVYDVFSVADTVSKTAGGSFDSAVTMSGTLTASGRVLVDDTTEATSTTDGSLQTDGGFSVAKDIVVGDDIHLKSDSAQISFGADSEVTLDHTADTGLTLQGSGLNTNFSLLSFHTTDSTTPDFRMGKSASNTVGTLSTTADGEFFGQIRFQGIDTNNARRDGATISVNQSGSATGSTAPGEMKFSTTGTERMRIFSSGRVGLADGTSPEQSAQLDVKRNSDEIVYFRNNSGVGVKLTAGNQSFSAVSDETKKENIVEINKQQSYDNIKNIKAITYNFKDIIKTDEDNNSVTYKDNKSRIGFIAQDWETNYSQLVNTDAEGVKTLLYTETVPVLLSALQKAQEKIEALEAKVTALENAE